jgi:hypothetical protein
MLVLYICLERESFHFWVLLLEVFFCSQRIFAFSAFAAISFEILKTRKLEEKELRLYLCNVRYMGCPKRSGQ